MAGEVHGLLGLQSARGHVLTIEEHHPAFATDTAVSVVHAVDGGVELVMASDGHEHQLIVRKFQRF